MVSDRLKIAFLELESGFSLHNVVLHASFQQSSHLTDHQHLIICRYTALSQ